MIEINGKEYEVNTDLKWGTEQLMNRIQKDPKGQNVERYMKEIIKDLLIPKPTIKEMFNFRTSDIIKIFTEYTDNVEKTNADFKKKLSR